MVILAETKSGACILLSMLRNIIVCLCYITAIEYICINLQTKIMFISMMLLVELSIKNKVRALIRYTSDRI